MAPYLFRMKTQPQLSTMLVDPLGLLSPAKAVFHSPVIHIETRRLVFWWSQPLLHDATLFLQSPF